MGEELARQILSRFGYGATPVVLKAMMIKVHTHRGRNVACQ